ncbi:MAG: terpene cyclase/mutase family protein [Magnetococcales bacterium]|nr:terpene cyclase/mutase family protein [Magnetococcales bacterium]
MPALSKLLAAPLVYKLWRRDHLRYIFRDLLNPASQEAQDDRSHLIAVLDWLCRAQDILDNRDDAGGISAGWSYEDGWLPGYPETSGYIVETFLAAAEILDNPDYKKRAGRILDWELSIQNPDGSFPGHFGETGSRPVIFNTGQIMFGLTEGFLHLQRQECLDGAVRAGQWLLKNQDDDGCWRRNTHGGIIHTYNSRAAWSLLRTARLANNLKLERGAEKNLRWAMSCQTESGWFEQNSFKLNQAPYTHTIAYAIRGLLEGGILLDDNKMVAAASKAAYSVLLKMDGRGWLAGAFADEWVAKGGYCCLTGLAQFSIIWSRLGYLKGDELFLEGAKRANSYLKRNHVLLGNQSPDHGGIAGSQPIWGAYSRFEYPNWAAKFFADAVMLQMENREIPSAFGKQP